MLSKDSIYFQDHMPENICYGCGRSQARGLRIRSYWDGEVSVCDWQPELHHQGWKGLLNGGIASALIDCHCMCTAMADAYRREGRGLASEPMYRYATGTLNMRFIRPTPIDKRLRIEARVVAVKRRKTTLSARICVNDLTTVEAEVIALRVYDSRNKGASHEAFVS